MSNVQRLIDAEILDPSKTRTQAQTDAIESLTDEEVDHLISTKAKLAPYISVSDHIIGIPRFS